MRRLNHILSVLTEPWLRAQYDLMSDSESNEPLQLDPRVARQRMLQELFHFDRKAAIWLACGALIAGILALTLADLHAGSTSDRTAGVDVTVADASSLPDATASLDTRIDELRKRFPPELSRGVAKSAVIPNRDDPAPAPEVSRFEPPPVKSPAYESRLDNRLAEQKQAPVALPPPPTIHPVQPDLARAMVAGPAMPSAHPPEVVKPGPANGIAGLWRYVPSKQPTPRPGVYSAEHVEVGISEEAGVLYGYYNAHYMVPDGVILPDVAFKFSGSSGNAAANGTWAGGNGNRGEIRLRTVSNNALEVIWITTHMEHANSLASGKVTLSRAN